MSYYDVTVLPTWKGPHKVGDLPTFACPGELSAAAWFPRSTARMILQRFRRTSTGETPLESRTCCSCMSRGAMRPRSRRGSDARETTVRRGCLHFPLRTTIAINTTESALQTAQPCFLAAGNCIAALDQSQETVKVRYRLDPLKTKYEGMPVPDFLKEVQSVRIR